MIVSLDTDTILNLVDPAIMGIGYVAGSTAMGIRFTRRRIKDYRKYSHNDCFGLALDSVAMVLLSPIWFPAYGFWKVLSFGIKKE